MKLHLFSVVLVALVLFGCTATAIHEDEQGLHDWIHRFVGNVNGAAVHASTLPEHLYVSSVDGAVAAIDIGPHGGADLTWRVMSSHTPLCITATSLAVVTVNDIGVVSLQDPKTGSVEILYQLEGVSSLLVAAACTASEDAVNVVVHDGISLRSYRLSLTSEEEVVPLIKTARVEPGVSQLSLGGGRLLVGRSTATTEVYTFDTLEKVSAVRGAVTSVANAGEYTTSAPSFVLFSAAVDEAPVEKRCDHCSEVIVKNPQTNELTGVVTVRGTKDAVVLSFNDAEVKIPSPESASAPSVLLAFNDGKGDVLVLVKTGSTNLLLVSLENGLVWQRHEALANSPATKLMDPLTALDHFHFNKIVVMASRYGPLYTIPLSQMGAKMEMVADISVQLAAELGIPSMKDVVIERLDPVSSSSVVVQAKYKTTTAFVQVSLATKEIESVSSLQDAILATPHLQITKDMSVAGLTHQGMTYTYVSHAAAGVMQGYVVSSASPAAKSTWTLRFPSSLVAHASGDDARRTAVVNNIHIYPNNTGKERVEEVRHMYPTRNVVAVAHYEPSEEELPSLVVTAIDVITGSILATTRHPNVEGAVKMVIVEHAIIYHFLDAKKMRYCFGVWELFEDENGAVTTKSAGATLPQIIASFFVNTDRTFSSRASRPPTVVATTLGAFGGPLADMGVTTSSNAIARKSIVLAFQTGRVAVVEALRFFSGGQMPMPDNKEKQLTHVLIPSILYATHKYRIASPQRITTEPTELESSCHVVVSGLDLFYVRSSSGKPFDLLNSDFNKSLLITLVCGFAAVSIVVRYFVTRKNLVAAWK